jgi:hypothetical protein
MAAPYAASQITGVVGADSIVTGKQMRDVSKGLFEIVDQNVEAQFLAVQSAISSGITAKNYKIEWFKKDIYPVWDVVATGFSAGAADTACTVVVTNANYFQIHDVVEFPDATVASGKMNQALVTNKSTVTLTIHPLDANYGVCAVATGEKIHNLSNSSSEYSTMPGIKLVKDVTEYNYVTFLRVPYAIGIFEMGMAQFTGDEENERETETMKFIKRMYENILIWGQRGKYTESGVGIKLFSRGVQKYLEADGINTYDWNSGMTEAQWDEWLMENPLKYGSQERDCFFSSDLINKIHSFGKTKERIISHNETLGLYFTKYRAPNGKILNIFQHQMMEESYEAGGLIVDNAYLDLRGFATEPTFQHHTDIQARDVAGRANEWRIIAGLVVKRTEPHGWLY